MAALLDGRRMITASKDKMLCLWDLKSGEVLKKMEEHRGALNALAVSRDGKLIASGDTRGELIASHGETGESLTRPIKVHSATILSIDFSPDGAVLATGLDDGTTKFVSTRTWQVQGNPIKSNCLVRCIRYSPSGTLLGIATREKTEIYKSGKRHCVAKFKGHRKTNFSLAWTPDGTRLLTGGDHQDPTIREWDISTWNRIISGGVDKKISEWTVPEDALPDDNSKCLASKAPCSDSEGGPKDLAPKAQDSDSKTVAATQTVVTVQTNVITKTARNTRMTEVLSTAEMVLTQNFDAGVNSYASYANRSFVMARKSDWDCALQDAIKSLTIHPSLAGCIAQGIVLCGKQLVEDARTAFELAFTFTVDNSDATIFLFLIEFSCLFGWELESLWQTANEKLCFSLLKAGRPGEAFESYKYGMGASDEATRSGLRAWIFIISL
ncbi:WD40 repeat-like protein [Suillus hirtellus]|nr:WD40 repeat-like protein [Suillus hirtellus]